MLSQQDCCSDPIGRYGRTVNPSIRIGRSEQVSCLSKAKSALIKETWSAVAKYTMQGKTMKKGIHPEYVECKVTCACGNKFEVKSTKSELSIDICNECHPFYTGSEKILDAAGRVDKFKKKYNLG